MKEEVLYAVCIYIVCTLVYLFDVTLFYQTGQFQRRMLENEENRNKAVTDKMLYSRKMGRTINWEMPPLRLAEFTFSRLDRLCSKGDSKPFKGLDN